MYTKCDYIITSGGLKVPLPDLSLYTVKKYYEADKNPRVYHETEHEEHLCETSLPTRSSGKVIPDFLTKPLHPVRNITISFTTQLSGEEN